MLDIQLIAYMRCDDFARPRVLIVLISNALSATCASVFDIYYVHLYGCLIV